MKYYITENSIYTEDKILDLYDNAPQDLIDTLNLPNNKRIIDCIIPFLLQKKDNSSSLFSDNEDWSDINSEFSVITIEDISLIET
tara:strand:- start:130 stop:384 length:255 start_codon:yes stop_codon:yes gene_type:complete